MLPILMKKGCLWIGLLFKFIVEVYELQFR